MSVRGRVRATIARAGAVALVGAIAGSSAAAQQTEAPVDLATWDYGALAAGWSAEAMIDEAEVYDQDGDLVGELEDLIVGPDDKIERAVIEAGGFLDIGDTHFSYPWAQVRIVGPDRLEVMLDEDKIDDYSVFGSMDDEAAPGRTWRISRLIKDYAYARGDVRYGWIDDVIFTDDGTLQSVIVYPDVTYRRTGPYALPYRGPRYGYEPGSDRYVLPYSPEEIAEMDIFVMPEQRGQAPGAGGEADETPSSEGGHEPESGNR